MAKATQKTLSEPKINDYILLNLTDGLKKIFNNESINFSINWCSFSNEVVSVLILNMIDYLAITFAINEDVKSNVLSNFQF